MRGEREAAAVCDHSPTPQTQNHFPWQSPRESGRSSHTGNNLEGSDLVVILKCHHHTLFI